MRRAASVVLALAILAGCEAIGPATAGALLAAAEPSPSDVPGRDCDEDFPFPTDVPDGYETARPQKPKIPLINPRFTYVPKVPLVHAGPSTASPSARGTMLAAATASPHAAASGSARPTKAPKPKLPLIHPGPTANPNPHAAPQSAKGPMPTPAPKRKATPRPARSPNATRTPQPTATPKPTPTPSATPSPGRLVLLPPSCYAGPDQARIFKIRQSNYGGHFDLKYDWYCAVTPIRPSGPGPVTITVRYLPGVPTDPGNVCTVTVSGGPYHGVQQAASFLAALGSPTPTARPGPTLFPEALTAFPSIAPRTPSPVPTPSPLPVNPPDGMHPAPQGALPEPS